MKYVLVSKYMGNSNGRKNDESEVSFMTFYVGSGRLGNLGGGLMSDYHRTVFIK